MTKRTDESDNQRERKLLKAILSTPQGQELREIWERRLTRVKAFPPEMSEAHCRYVSGRHSVYIDALKTLESE